MPRREVLRGGGGPTAGIEGLIESWARSWNTHDMHGAAALVDADVDFVTVAGLWLRGRDEFLRHHDRIHRAHMRETAWATLAYEVRPLHDHLALIHLEWTITGELASDGTRRPPRPGIFTWVVGGTGDTWLIAAAHNTNLRAETPHRLATRGKP
jgi:uncharacterized protein (TIGR02246 family)